MTDTENVATELIDRVFWIRIDRPERKNAIDSATRIQLRRAFDAATGADEARVVVLSGTGGSFSAGVDLKESRSESRHPLSLDQEPLVAAVTDCPKPVIAAIDGPAVGGGFELALAADMRVATRRSFFALTELRIGSLPGSGGTQRLFRAVPSAIAWRILLTGERIDALRAYEVGLISDLVSSDDFSDSVQQIAEKVALAAPLSLRAAKLAGRAGMAGSAEVGIALERSLFAMLATTRDRAEGRAAFNEKRDPQFEGH